MEPQIVITLEELIEMLPKRVSLTYIDYTQYAETFEDLYNIQY